jgi:hypothetical protein
MNVMPLIPTPITAEVVAIEMPSILSTIDFIDIAPLI